MAVALPADLQPARKKYKPAVLEEDEYTEAVQKIIERDFFPDIARRRLQVRRTAHSHIDPAVSTVNSPCVLTVFVCFFQIELLAATSSGNPQRIWEVQRRIMTELRSAHPTPAQTPGSATPQFGGGVPLPQRSDITKNLSLDKFMTKYTSEDNAAFEVVFEKNLQDRRQKYAWLRFDDPADNASQLALEGSDPANALAIVDDRSGVPKQWKYKARNSLMYMPEGLPPKPCTDPDVVMGPPKAVVLANTRISDPAQTSGAEEKALREAASKPAHSYLLTPSPAPGVDDTPLMTWGEIEGTPLLLGGARAGLGDTAKGPTFSMQAMGKREKAGHSLSRVAGKRLHSKNQRIGSERQVLPSPSPRPHSSRHASQVALSPAAQRLLRNTPGASAKGLRDASLRASYGTPKARSAGPPGSSVRSTPSGTPSRTPSRGEGRGAKQPSVARTSKTAEAGKLAAGGAAGKPAAGSITDGLLDL